MRPTSPRLHATALAALLAAGLTALPTASAATTTSSDTSAHASKAKTKKQSSKKKTKKKKRTTSERVTILSRKLNTAKAQQRKAQKQLDALVKQQGMIDEQLAAAVGQINTATAIASAPAIAAMLQDPATGIPQLLDTVATNATAGIQALLASQEYAVAVVTIGDTVVSPTLIVSPDIPDIGAPVTFSATVPVVVPPGLDNEPIHVRVGAVSLENDGTSDDNPAFVAGLNRFAVTQDGYTGNVGDAILRGGNNGVSRTYPADGITRLCQPSADGCGAPVWSAPNPKLGNLPYYPVSNKLVSFGDKPGVSFELGRMTALTAPGRLASLTNNGTPPIYVSTYGGSDRNGVSLLKAEVSLTAIDLSANPADPLA